MVNLTPDPASSSPSTSPINQSGLVTVQANEEGCNDDPPPIPQPLAGNTRDSQSHQSAGGVPIPSDQHDDVTAPSASVYPIEREANDGRRSQVKVYDYGASPGQDLPPLTKNVSSATTVTSASPNSSFTAVGTLTDETTIEVLADPYDGKNPHAVDAEAVAATLGVDFASGLKTADAKEKLMRDGPNKLTGDGGTTWYGVLIRQVSNSLTLVCYIDAVSPVHHVLAIVLYLFTPGEETNPILTHLIPVPFHPSSCGFDVREAVMAEVMEGNSCAGGWVSSTTGFCVMLQSSHIIHVAPILFTGRGPKIQTQSIHCSPEKRVCSHRCKP
jgi:hypothetical protein